MKQTESLFKKSSMPIISFMLFVVYLFPKSLAYYMTPLLFTIILIFYYKNILRNFYVKFMFLVVLIISLLYTFSISGAQEIIRYVPIMLMIFMFPYKGISLKYVTPSTVVIVSILIFTQVAIALDISVVTELRNYLYPIENDFWSVSVSEFNIEFSRDKRYGGIYYNPNVLGQLLTLAYLLILLSDLKLSTKSLLSVFVLIGLLLTGSRTAIMVYFISTVLFYYYNTNSKSKLVVKILVIVFGLFSLFISGVMIESIIQGIVDPRGSLYIKMSILIDYLNPKLDNLSGIVDILFGSGVTNIIFDSDIGDIIGHFGLLSFISIMAFIVYMYKKTTKQLRYVFTVFLFAFGNTLIYNLQSSLILLIILMMTFHKTHNNFKKEI